MTGNVDNLEGGLDGVVQAIACTKEVGWARKARKLMLVATDGLLHFAGDGKVGEFSKKFFVIFSLYSYRILKYQGRPGLVVTRGQLSQWLY